MAKDNINELSHFCNSTPTAIPKKVIRANFQRYNELYPNGNNCTVDSEFLSKWFNVGFSLLYDYRGCKRAVVLLRASTTKQARNGSLEAQEHFLINYLESKGWEILKVYREIDSAKSDNWEFRVVPQLAIQFAKDNDAVVVMTTLSRMFRPHNFSNTNKRPKLSWEEICKINESRNKIVFLTAISPNSTFEEETSFSTKINIDFEKSKKRGEYKIEKKLLMKDKIMELHLKHISVRQISKLLELPKSTVSDWLKSYLKSEDEIVN